MLTKWTSGKEGERMPDEGIPRIEPLPEDEWDAELRTLIDQSWSGPPPGNRNNLYRTLARHRLLFRTWSELGRVLLNSRLPARDRELLILRTAWLTRCRFEWAYHEPLALRVGISQAEIRRVLSGPDAPGWDERDATLVGAVDELVSGATLADATWDRLLAWYDEQQLIEIPAIVGQYQLVAYLTNAIRIQPHGHLPVLPES
jgi:4-carboxymuconolactone decarboxylase